MNFLQRILKTRQQQAQAENWATKQTKVVVTTRDAAKDMQETGTIKVPKYDEHNVKEPKISMFH